MRRDVRRRNDQVERDRPLGIDRSAIRQSQADVVAATVGIAIEPEERHGRREHAGAFILGLVQDFARGRRDDGMHLRLLGVPRWLVAIIARSVCSNDRLRIGEEGGDAGQRLLLLGVEDMEDGADQQRVAGLLPMAAAFKRAFGIDQDVGDVLDVADLVRAFAHFEQRVVAGTARIGRIEQQAVRETSRASRR